MAPFTDEYLFIEIANKVCNVFIFVLCVCLFSDEYLFVENANEVHNCMPMHVETPHSHFFHYIILLLVHL